ncbi:MAG: ABC transporter substrate-binding protein, partial [Candidatus Poribacteria bacterium]|nr:ABC transporter substrate-binding protein [Candidatus Poribacteria bacterium]
MNQIKTITLLLFNIVLIAGICGCDELVTVLSDNGKLDELPQEIVVGIVVPMSGIYYVEPEMNRFFNGFYMARDEINRKQLGSHQLRFIVEDDRSTIEGAIEAYNKLVNEDKVAAIIGPASSTQVQMAFPVAQEKQFVAIGPSSAAQGLSAIGDFVFRVNLTVDKLIPRGVQLTHDKLGYQRVAKLVTNDDSYSQSADAILTESLDAVGVEIVTTETFDLR